MPLSFAIKPFYDDFDEKKHFYRVLFRPSVAVQARELTQTQSILQQQIKYLGDSLYKHGSMVIPGQVGIDFKTAYVRLKPTYGFLDSTPIPINLALFTGKVIQGQTTNLQAQVVYSVEAINTDSPTLYVKYLNTGTNGETVFASDEILTFKNSTVGLAQVETNAPTGLAISAQIDVGAYYIWGIFVRVEQQYLLLSKYTNVVSTRIGLNIVESIITPEEDITLTDNAQGEPNYAAPGAYRYKIDLILNHKDIDDISNDENFVELSRLINSVVQTKITTDTYSVIAKELAQRMADTNGDFAVRNFAMDVREHLDTSFVTAGTVAGATVATTLPTPATIKLATSASAIDDAYNNKQLFLSNGPGAGQNFIIVDYIGATKTATLDEDYKPNQVPDTTTSYIISDPTKINRGIYPPAPFGAGSIDKLAVGLESGRAYVDGYRIDTLATSYVTVDKARDSAQAVNSLIQTPIGNFLLVKNIKNIPLAAATAPKDFLTINFSNIKATGGFNLSQNGLGTARVHSIEFSQGTNAAASDALFKMYLFDVKINPGVDINTIRSFYLANDISHNNNGNGLNAWGDVCAVFNATNINGTGLIPGAIISGPSGVGTEVLVSYDPINNNIFTEPNGSNTNQILTNGQFTGPSNTTGTLSNRTQIFNTQSSTLVYQMPQHLIKTIRASDTSIRTSYFVRATFESQRNNSGQYIISTASNAPFAPFNATDYMACVVSSSNPSDVGKTINLAAYIDGGSFSGSPANTTLTFSILSGLGATSGCVIKLVATLFKTAAGERIKNLTTTSLAYQNPTATMSLQKADIISIDRIIDSGNPAVDADPNNPAHVDIKSRYVFDNGQRDYYYDVGSVIKFPAAPSPAGRVLIIFKYFAHSGSGDYFSVDSYANQVDYANIPTYPASNGNFYVLRDCIDFRPRKDDFNFGFSGTGSGFSAPLSPSNLITTDFQYYLPRVDKIYLDQYGGFNVIKGTSGLLPLMPADPIDGMMLYTISLNPYTLSTSDMKVTATKNPKYTMHDIGKLEDRIANLEYYTSLNQLEQQTATFQVTDTSTGLDRFKNGFVVDNFTGHNVGNVFDSDYKCSVDPSNNILRPTFVQNSNDLNFNIDASSGYVNRSNLLMLPYTEALTVRQPFATDVVNCNPFAIFQYHGDISLIPNTDTWKDTQQRPVINIDDSKNLLDGYRYSKNWEGTTWGDWQTSWVGTPTTSTTSSTTSNKTSGGVNSDNEKLDANGNKIFGLGLQTSQPFVSTGTAAPFNTKFATGSTWDTADTGEVLLYGCGGGISQGSNTKTTVTTSQQITQTRVGTQTTVTYQASQKVNSKLIDASLSPYIRSRRIKVLGKHFKPLTRLYPYFDNTNISGFCRPFADPQITPTLTGPNWAQMNITWGGDFNPQANQNQGTTADAGDTGQTASLLVGNLNDPIFADALGTVTLFFEIPCNDASKFRVGARPFRLTTSKTNDVTADAFGDATYNASGIIDQVQETITSIYTPEIQTKQVSDTRIITQNKTVTKSVIIPPKTSDDGHHQTPFEGGGGVDAVSAGNAFAAYVASEYGTDPVAQAFKINESGGAYITKIEVYFRDADVSVPIMMQIRNMVNGYPGQDIVPLSQRTLYPNELLISSSTRDGGPILPPPPHSEFSGGGGAASPFNPQLSAKVVETSDDASVPTTFVFDAPIYLNDGTEYAMVLIADSLNYNLYTAKLGGTVVGSTNIVSTPPYLGTLFKSQNASTWVPDPTQTLKFNIYKAQFDPTNTAQLFFNNSSVQADTLTTLPFQTVQGSNIVRVYQTAHMMPKGQFVNSIVNISNVAPGTYNGLTDAQLTGQFSIDNVDLNSYTITVSGSPASSTSRVGPDGVVASRNYQYDSICPVFNTLTPSGTNIDWSAKFTTGKSPNNNGLASQEPYIKSSEFEPISINTTTDFLSPNMVASEINETTSIVGVSAFDRKSLVFKGVLSTSSVNLTPIVDLTRTSTVLINNQIDDPTFANYTLQNMDKGVVVTSTSSNSISFDCQVVVSVVAVTGGQFAANETVTGAVSEATGIVVSWDGANLTLSNVTGVFQTTEAISGTSAIGTVQSFEYVNTITNPNGVLDFSVFIPGYLMTIDGAPANPYPYSSPVTILAVNGNQIQVDTGTIAPFTPATNQANVQLTQYVRFVNESGPHNCTTASRYITRQFNLANPANSLHILFTINRPPGSFVDCYYRVLKSNSTQAFETLTWKLASLDATVDDGLSTNPDQFKEYVYTINNIGAFTAFSIKLVMRGGNSSQVPKVKDFRGIALAI